MPQDYHKEYYWANRDRILGQVRKYARSEKGLRTRVLIRLREKVKRCKARIMVLQSRIAETEAKIAARKRMDI